LVPLLSARNAQLMYEAAFCVWGLSLVPALCPALEAAGVAAAAGRLVRETLPSKVVRMAVGALANLARHPQVTDPAVPRPSLLHWTPLISTLALYPPRLQAGDLTVADVSETHVPATLEALSSADATTGDPEVVRLGGEWDGGFWGTARACSDPCPPTTTPDPTRPALCVPPQAEDMRFLSEALRSNKRRLSSMERYERELAAKRFDWTAVHSSEFWKDNALAFEAGDFRLIAALGDLLGDAGTDETTLAVALNDIGEFAVHHPSGRAVLAHLGLRPVVMGFLRREEDALRQQALLACSKLMVVRWQYVGGNTTSGAAAAAAAAGGEGGTPRASPTVAAATAAK
jgi:hypothetical protein